MQVYDIQISGASDVERINAQGDYIYYSNGLAGGSSACVEVRGINTGFRVKLMPGQGMRLPLGRVERDWLIKPDTQISGSLIGAVVIGEGEIFDNRVTGSVEVISGELSRTDASVAFYGSTSTGATVGQYSVIQLINPTGGNKDLIVTSVSCVTSANQSVQVRAVDQLIGVVDSNFPNAISKGGVGVSVGQIRYGTVPSVVGVRLLHWYAEASKFNRLQFVEPIVLKPGKGVAIHSVIQNTDLLANFEFWQR